MTWLAGDGCSWAQVCVLVNAGGFPIVESLRVFAMAVSAHETTNRVQIRSSSIEKPKHHEDI